MRRLTLLLTLVALASPFGALHAQGRARRDSNSKRGKLSSIARRGTEKAKTGILAPDFALPFLDESTAKPTFVSTDAESGSPRVRLSDFRGKRPVVLIFGSYT